MRHPEKPQRGGLTLRLLGGVLRGRPALTAGLVLAVLAAAGCGLIPPQLLRIFIDRHLSAGNLTGVGALAAAYVLALAAVGAADFAKGALLISAGQKLVHGLRAEMMRKLTRIESEWFARNDPGSIASRFIADADNVSGMFTDGLAGMLVDCLKIVGILLSVALFSWRLLVLALVFLPVIWLITRQFQRASLAAQKKNLEQLGRVSSHISETVRSLPMIRGYAREAFLEQIYRRRLQDNFETVETVNFYDSLYPVLVAVLKAVSVCAIVLLSGLHTVLGLSAGTAAAAIDLFAGLFAPIETLGMELQSLQRGLSGAQRIDAFDLLPEEPARDPALTAEAILARGGGRASLSLTQVGFAYQEGRPVLQDVSFDVPAGQSVTVAGRTGVGKTTLFRLIMGLLSPQQGTLTLNGVSVAAIPNREKRRLFGYVEQHFSFVPGTVLTQITLGDPAVTRQAAAQALDFVGLGETVAALPQGLDTPVDAGSAFSQGQKQLLAIARAIAADPAVLLLDEVTANLDSVTEAHVVRVLAKAGRGRTVLAISHRLTSMQQCDTIVLLEDGRVRACGAPAELAVRDEAFRRRLALEQSSWDE